MKRFPSVSPGGCLTGIFSKKDLTGEMGSSHVLSSPATFRWTSIRMILSSGNLNSIIRIVPPWMV